MKLNHLEPAIDMLSEITILRTLLKIRMKDKLIANNLLAILSLQEACKYLMDHDTGLQQIMNDLAHALDLLDEHLDYFIPTTKMWEQLTSI